jgi:predicted ATPase
VRPALPSGTVTFLLTDVEGSTRLLHELGAVGYAEALGEHRRVIRQACTAERGVEVDTQGDAFFFAFPSAPGALAAATVFTEALASGPIQVRVGLHTGSPLLTDEGYVGDDVHLAARVASCAHGGQIVLSASTAALVESELRNLGEHRLKDIAEAVPIFQLGSGSFPPLKTISNTNLPRPASSFVGRERELIDVLTRLENGARLLTLTGPGGSGKTRLALEAASTLVPEYKAGVFWVGLAALRDPTLVTETIAQTLGAKDGLAEHIGERELLLLLDNLEQVIEAAPELASLLEACPNLDLLCTSRELLRVRGEIEFEVPPLAEPEAVVLFCERSGLEASEEVTELCARLDNLPLAVELAAARTKALTPAHILERLSQRLDLLKGGRDADPRQQTLRATIEWSYELLSPEEQRLLARLSVFAGGCTLEAAEEVCEAGVDALQSLVEKSLLRFSNGRYWMLETIREYARERLGGSNAAEQVRDAHAAWFAALAARAELRGPEHGVWLERLRAEHANMRVALAWLGERGHAVVELALACDLGEYAYHSGALLEGRRWLDDALAHADGAPPELRARTLAFNGLCAIFQGDLEVADHRTEAGLDLARACDDPLTLGEALRARALFLGHSGDAGAAEDLGDEALQLSRAHGLDALLADLANNMGYDALEQGDLGRAEAFLSESVAAGRARGDAIVLSISLSNLALLEFERGAYERAGGYLTESLRLARQNSLGPASVAALVGAEVLMAHAGAMKASARVHGSVERLLEETGEPLQRVEQRVRDGAFARTREALGANETERAASPGRDIDTGVVAQEVLSWLEAFPANAGSPSEHGRDTQAQSGARHSSGTTPKSWP